MAQPNNQDKIFFQNFNINKSNCQKAKVNFYQKLKYLNFEKIFYLDC